jgi:hypothetical protein
MCDTPYTYAGWICVHVTHDISQRYVYMCHARLAGAPPQCLMCLGAYMYAPVHVHVHAHAHMYSERDTDRQAGR